MNHYGGSLPPPRHNLLLSMQIIALLPWWAIKPAHVSQYLITAFSYLRLEYEDFLTLLNQKWRFEIISSSSIANISDDHGWTEDIWLPPSVIGNFFFFFVLAENSLVRISPNRRYTDRITGDRRDSLKKMNTNKKEKRVEVPRYMFTAVFVRPVLSSVRTYLLIYICI